MADDVGKQTFDLKKDLLKKGSRYTFFQAVRLLHYFIQKELGSILNIHEFFKRIKIHPQLSLDFPTNDIKSIRQLSEDTEKYLLTSTFLGLYGSSSPLPTFYTEELLDEAGDDGSITRDFIDIFNQPFYELLFSILFRYRLHYEIDKESDTDLNAKLFNLLGFQDSSFYSKFKKPRNFLRYLGLATQFPRSAEGLRIIISDIIKFCEVEIIQCVPNYVKIPDEQMNLLGQESNVLGQDCYLDSLIQDRQGKFRIVIGPFENTDFRKCLPEGNYFNRIKESILFYLDTPLEWELEIVIKKGLIDQIQLGRKEWNRLGLESWVFSEKIDDEIVSIVFQGE